MVFHFGFGPSLTDAQPLREMPPGFTGQIQLVNLSHQLRKTALMKKIFIIALCLAPSLALADDPMPGKWSITKKSSVTISGRTQSMPQPPTEACLDQQQLTKAVTEGLMPHANQGQTCTMLDQKTLPDGVSYHMSCTGERPTDITGENHVSATTFESKMTMTAAAVMTSTLELSMKRVGGC